ncbi:hypothetical protein STRTUCAR8_00895 [Streptomyces turgidiscabies Car8]|uniref:Uncharacterized protein n=1 Tax=Streptomyces turgidiscabies (strain Car8) TaxID=698760 RepID=L7FF11_STRT8|nr:hypothetical protein STRTUCAR8_00895 [Streptomyces turgidiscabies Car8]
MTNGPGTTDSGVLAGNNAVLHLTGRYLRDCLSGDPTSAKRLGRFLEAVPGSLPADLDAEGPLCGQFGENGQVRAGISFDDEGGQRLGRADGRIGRKGRRFSGCPADALHAASRSEQVPCQDELGAADVVDHYVDRSLKSLQSDQNLVGAGLGQPLPAGGRAYGRDHMGTGPRRQLDGEPADPAGGAGDQHPLVRSEPGGPQRTQRRHPGDRQSRGPTPTDRVRTGTRAYVTAATDGNRRTHHQVSRSCMIAGAAPGLAL